MSRQVLTPGYGGGCPICLGVPASVGWSLPSSREGSGHRALADREVLSGFEQPRSDSQNRLCLRQATWRIPVECDVTHVS